MLKTHIQTSTKVAIWKTVNSFDQSVSCIRVSLPKSESIKSFTIRNKVSFAISHSGTVYFWGELQNKPEILAKLKETNFLDLDFLRCEPKIFGTLRNICITQLSCNESAALFLAQDGTLYSYGADYQKVGILGQGDIYLQNTPQPIKALLDHTITNISVGISHACAINSVGNLFTWGTGEAGQLGIKEVTRCTVPKRADSSKVFGVKQAICSYSSTIILTGISFIHYDLGGGYVYIYGDLNKSKKSFFEPRQISKISNDFIVKISTGDNFIVCLSSIFAYFYLFKKNMEKFFGLIMK